MAAPLDPKDLVTFKELRIANSIQINTLIQILVEDGIISEQRFFYKLKQVQSEYLSRQPNAS